VAAKGLTEANKSLHPSLTRAVPLPKRSFGRIWEVPPHSSPSLPGEGDRREAVVEGQARPASPPAPPHLEHHQPCGLPLFCWSSHVLSGAKYSTSALPDISRLPVNTCNASGQGLDWPIASIAFSFWPTALLP